MYYDVVQERVCTITELEHRVLSYERLKILLDARGLLVGKSADNTRSRKESLGSDVTNCGARITSKLEGKFKDRELSGYRPLHV